MKKIALVLLLASLTAQADDSYMGEIIGGVAGGIIGNQVGKGDGRAAATAIGAGIGAIVGGRVEDSMNQNRGYRYDPYAVPQNPYYIQQTTYTRSCTPWTETMDRYGNLTRTRTCYN